MSAYAEASYWRKKLREAVDNDAPDDEIDFILERLEDSERDVAYEARKDEVDDYLAEVDDNYSSDWEE